MWQWKAFCRLARIYISSSVWSKHRLREEQPICAFPQKRWFMCLWSRKAKMPKPWPASMLASPELLLVILQSHCGFWSPLFAPTSDTLKQNGLAVFFLIRPLHLSFCWYVGLGSSQRQIWASLTGWSLCKIWIASRRSLHGNWALLQAWSSLSWRDLIFLHQRNLPRDLSIGESTELRGKKDQDKMYYSNPY